VLLKDRDEIKRGKEEPASIHSNSQTQSAVWHHGRETGDDELSYLI